MCARHSRPVEPARRVVRRAGDLRGQGARSLRPLMRGPPQAPPGRRTTAYRARAVFRLLDSRFHPLRLSLVARQHFRCWLKPNQPNRSGFSASASASPPPPPPPAPAPAVAVSVRGFCSPTGSTLLAGVGLRWAFSGVSRCARSWSSPCSARGELAGATAHPAPTACGRGGPIAAAMGGRPRLSRWPSWVRLHIGMVVFSIGYYLG